jgi:uncharacterized protein YjeT (DUF2065 family)
MTALALALGLVLVVEGLVLVALPGRLDALLRALAETPLETRRLLGLGSLAAGVGLIWLAGGLPG